MNISADSTILTLNSSLNHVHLAFNETFGNGNKYEISAGVGLLSRNIRIIAAEYDSQLEDLYGFRMLIWEYTGRLDYTITNYKGGWTITLYLIEYFTEYNTVI